MLSVTGNYFKTGDKPAIRKFANFVLRKFVRNGILRKAKITIKVLHVSELEDADDIRDFKMYRAWCTYDGNDYDGAKKFTVILNVSAMRKSKNIKTRLKNLMIDLGHELVHVKQYLNGEMRDYVDGSYKFLGNKYDPIPDGEFSDEYFDSPSEIEAYGREQGLCIMFWHKVKTGEIVL